MAGRDTSALYSGRTGSVTVPKRRQQLEEAEKQEKLDPKAEAVLLLIAHEKSKISHIAAISLDSDVTDPAVILQLRVQQAQYKFLRGLETKMKRILGVREEPETPNAS
jgi:hypothetical protein